MTWASGVFRNAKKGCLDHINVEVLEQMIQQKVDEVFQLFRGSGAGELINYGCWKLVSLQRSPRPSVDYRGKRKRTGR